MHDGVVDRQKVFTDDSRRSLGNSAKEGESPVQASERDEQDPKYHETRETLWEVGGTTPQG